ncbi:DUF6056 family protein [Herbaspirillum aquaticum]|jgi:hypothetical protein|uniref:Transmembrane protein n=1 Tax=Herbaspirillum aquaticum TaxID=568783 RepID=A0A225STG2_9BURK|nr:DUF6056 family protein [Herbaspirillum aquaticum]OWY34444.1 hypothetical protein CEJ45_11395 [Herbaspirillum aquaticum]
MASTFPTFSRTGSRFTDARLAAIAHVLLLSGAVAVFAWIAWNAWHAIAAVDDFCYGYGAQERGLWSNLVFEYFNWGGRFAATVLISSFAGARTLLLDHYYLVPLTILLLNLLAARVFLSAVGLRSWSFYVLFCMMLLATFRMRESLFWLSGGATYGTACALLLLLMAQEWKIYSGAVEAKGMRLVWLALGGFLLAGFNEVASLVHLTLVVLLSGSLLLRQRRGALYLLAALGALAGTLVAGLAPGNFARAATTAHDTSLVSALLLSLGLLFKKYAATLILHSLIFFVIMWACRIAPWTRPQGWQPAVLIGVLLLALWAGIFPRAYALNELGPERSRTIDFLLVNVMAMIAALWLNGKRSARDDTPRPIVAGLLSVVVLGAVASAVLVPAATVLPVWSGLQESAALRRLMDERIVTIEQSDHQSVVVKAYTREPKPVTYFNDVLSDPRQWENICFANYFHLKEVSAR